MAKKYNAWRKLGRILLDPIFVLLELFFFLFFLIGLFEIKPNHYPYMWFCFIIASGFMVGMIVRGKSIK